MSAICGKLPGLGPLAQSVEQRTFNPWVVGSKPTGPTYKFNYCVSVTLNFCYENVSVKPRRFAKYMTEKINCGVRQRASVHNSYSMKTTDRLL